MLIKEIYTAPIKNDAAGDEHWYCPDCDVPLECERVSNQYEWYGCPKCGNYIKVD